MANPFVHALVFLAAVIIPGGLLVYFGWRTYKVQADRKAASMKVVEAREAFRKHFPVEGDSLRARDRQRRLTVYKTRSRK